MTHDSDHDQEAWIDLTNAMSEHESKWAPGQNTSDSIDIQILEEGIRLTLDSP